MIKEILLSDIELQLHQGAPSDDSELEIEQIAKWVQDHLNDLVRKEILDETAKGNPIPPIYIVRETALELTEEELEDMDNEKQRMYLELEDEVLDLPRDMGVLRVLDYDLNLIRKTSVENLEDVRSLRFAKPSQNNALHYREGKKIFIEGFNTADISFEPFIVDYVKKQNILELADDGEVLISDQLIPILIAAAVQTGKLQMYGTQPDEESDSKDTKKTAYHLAINNPSAAQNTQPNA